MGKGSNEWPRTGVEIDLDRINLEAAEQANRITGMLAELQDELVTARILKRGVTEAKRLAWRKYKLSTEEAAEGEYEAVCAMSEDAVHMFNMLHNAFEGMMDSTTALPSALNTVLERHSVSDGNEGGSTPPPVVSFMRRVLDDPSLLSVQVDGGVVAMMHTDGELLWRVEPLNGSRAHGIEPWEVLATSANAAKQKVEQLIHASWNKEQANG